MGDLARRRILGLRLVAFHLVALHQREDVDDGASHRRAHDGVCGEGVKCAGEGHRQNGRRLIRIGPALGVRRNRQCTRDAVEPRGEDCGDHQVGVGSAVAEAHLQSRARAALGRHSQHCAAVVEAPIGSVRRQGVRAESFVGVDCRVGERRDGGGIVQDARDHVLRGARQLGAVRHEVRATRVDHREVQVEPAATLVAPRFAEERRMLAGAGDDVAHGGLEQERAVSGIQRLAVPQVDLVLRRAELVIAREHADVHPVEHPEQVQERAVGIDPGAGRVDAAGAVDGAAPPRLVVLGDVELEFWADNRGEAKGAVLLDHFAQDGTRRDLAHRPIGIECVGDDHGDARFPRHHLQRRRVDPGHQVGQAAGHDVVAVENAAASRGDPQALAEGRALGLLKLADQQILRPSDAENVGEDQPQHVDAPGVEFGTKSSYIDTHGTSGS